MSAFAQAQPAGPNPLGNILLLVGFIAIFYFIMIRPQQKQAKAHKSMVASLKKGDEVIIGGGVMGNITQVNETIVQVQVANNVELTVQRQSIATLLPKGTLKNSKADKADRTDKTKAINDTSAEA